MQHNSCVSDRAGEVAGSGEQNREGPCGARLPLGPGSEVGAGGPGLVPTVAISAPSAGGA